MEDNKITKTVENVIVDDIKKVHKDYGTFVVPICVLVLVIAAALSLFLVKDSIRLAATSAKNGYEKAKNSQYTESYEKAYQTAFEKNRVSQKVSISIGDIREISKLEVLRVSEQSYTIQDEETKKSGITFWTKNTVFGIYTIDLSIAEFIVENDNNYILVRVPQPVLTTSPSGQYETLLYKKSGITDGSDKVGSELAKKQLKFGEAAIRTAIEENQNYKTKARESGKEIIENFIRALNPGNDSLKIDIEYID